MGQPPTSSVPRDKDFIDLTKAEADGLVDRFKVQKEMMKDTIEVTITGPIKIIEGDAEKSDAESKFIVRVRFKAKN